MEIFLYLIIFFIGTVFGSFFTLAVYRIPLNKNITHERSFCPNCNHRLEALDLIPVWSYIFLRGKCRYCKTKVRPRYIILEVLSGIVFVLAFISMKISFLDISYLYLGINQNNTLQKLIYLLAFIFFYVTNAIIIGIDKEYKTINKKVLIFGIITEMIYILYLYIFEQINIYRYGIYLIIILLLVIILKYTVGPDASVRSHNNIKYIIQNLIYLTYIMMFINNLNIIFVIIISLLIYAILYIISVGADVSVRPQKNNIDYKPKNQIPIGFGLGISSIIIVIIQNFIIV